MEETTMSYIRRPHVEFWNSILINWAKMLPKEYRIRKADIKHALLVHNALFKSAKGKG